MFDVRRLRALRAVAQHGTFAAAANVGDADRRSGEPAPDRTCVPEQPPIDG